MLLAAKGREFAPLHDGKAPMEQGALEVIFCNNSEIGDKITLNDEKSTPKKMISIEEVEKIKITVKNFEVVCNGKQLVTKKEQLRMVHTKEGDVG